MILTMDAPVWSVLLHQIVREESLEASLPNINALLAPTPLVPLLSGRESPPDQRRQHELLAFGRRSRRRHRFP
jgi:hypothetical protein